MRRQLEVLMRSGIVVAAAAVLSAQTTIKTVNGGSGQMLTGDILGSLTGAPSTPMATGTGLIYGQVVDGLSARAVSGALVTLSIPSATPVRVLTDGEGRFTFRDVPKGHFSLAASKPGFADGAYGRVRPGGQSQGLDLTDGQRVTDAAIPVWKFGAIAGTVLDESGEPVVNATVSVLKRTVTSGQPQLTAAGPTVTTDDRGMYRVGSLEPGDYLVVLPMTQDTSFDGILAGAAKSLAAAGGATGTAVAAAFRMNVQAGGGGTMTVQTSDGSPMPPAGITEDGHLLWYQATFFPTAVAAARATPITLANGEEHAGVDFALRAVRTVDVSGVVSGPDGPASSLLLDLFPADADGLVTPVETATAMTDAAGQFSFPRVPPGQYTLRGTRQPRLGAAGGQTTIMQSGNGMMLMQSIVRFTGAGSPPLPTEPTLWLEQPVTVGTSDIPDLNLGLRQGLKVSGRAEFSGATAPPNGDQMQGISIGLDPADPRTSSVASSARGRFDAGGQFTTVGVPDGKYVLRISPPSGWNLRAAMYNGRDVSDQPLEIKDGDVDGITISFTDKTTRLTGKVTSASGSGDAKADVIIFPDDPSQWATIGPSPRRIKNIRANGDGSFSTSLPAGDYLVAAVSDAEAANWNDARFLTDLARSASHVSLAEGDTKTQALKTAPAPQISGGGL